MALKTCSHCGSKFINIGSHSPYCLQNPRREEALEKARIRVAKARESITPTPTGIAPTQVPCRFCGIMAARSHGRFCPSNPEKEVNLRKAQNTLQEARDKRNLLLEEAIRTGGPRPSTKGEVRDPERPVSAETRKKLSQALKGKKHTEDSKLKMSRVRIAWLHANPDKHPWVKSSKFRSVPCEHLKSTLKKTGFEFEEEYMPLRDRFFRLDLAFKEIKLGIEVNGYQHYSNKVTLKPYYQRRHDLLVNEGWHILEVLYLRCWDEQLLTEISQLVEERSLTRSLNVSRNPLQTPV